MALERFHQSTGRMGAKIIEGVCRQDCAIECRRIGNGVRQPELVSNAISVPDTVPAILRLPKIKTIEMGKLDNRLGFSAVMLQRIELYGSRLKAWAPEQGLAIRRGFRIGWKIAAPNVA